MQRKIVILGAGFGGLHAALKLGRALKWGRISDCEIVLVDKNDYHTYYPTLYEIATTSKDVSDYIGLKAITTFSIPKILKGLPVKFAEDEAESIDIGSGENSVHLKSGYNLHYDYLIMALGSISNDFGIPGIKESYSFKSFTDALRIRDRIWEEITKGPKDQELQIVIGGAGSTGVELAGELRIWLNQLAKKYERKASVTICEGSPTILPGFKPEVIAKVEARLKKLGVKLINGKMIKGVNHEEKKILFEGEEIKADVFIWAGGVKANNLLEGMPMKQVKGRVQVSELMTCLPENTDLTFAGQVLGIGDVACINNPKTNMPVPMVARAAIQEAKVAAENIIRDINARPKLVFKPGEYPYVIPVGGKYAVAKIGNVVISGFLAWVLKGLVELNYLLSIMPVWRAIGKWLKGLWIFIKNDRLG